MRLLYHSFYLPALLKDSKAIAGGAAVQWKSWIKGFVNTGHNFGLLTFRGANNFINKKLDFDIVECFDPEFGIRKLRIFYYRIPQMIIAIRRYKPDYLIQGASTPDTFILMLIAKILNIPFVHRIASDADVDDRIKNLIDNKFIIYIYRIGQRCSDYIFAQNSYQQRALKKKYPNKNIFILHNPFEMTTIKDEILSRKNRRYIAWIGNFRPIKNLKALADTAEKLNSIEFKVAGSEHRNLDDETIESLERLKKMSNVELVGYLRRDEMNSFLAKSIALLNTSFNEGFSNTFLEAWSLGVPVVSTKYVNPDNIIDTFTLGEISNDFDSIPFSVQKIVDLDADQYMSLAYQCYDYVKKFHDPEMLANKFINLLNENSE